MPDTTFRSRPANRGTCKVHRDYLSRFNLFFPEKRPFFLENAGQFSVGEPGDVELFFSRRIGISEDGDVIPIRGGARVSGKVDNTNVGFLYMQTEDGGGGLNATHLHAAGYGETDPVAPNTADDGRQQNRRVELVLLPNVEEMLDLKSMI